tara:strand:+ start:2537 stop:3457 length:921 start_codon:yes stop_codon:yes gene_type:complete
MLGLGLESSQFPRPLHIFDNNYALQFNGVDEGIHITRHASMLANKFTFGLFVGDCESYWDQSSTYKALSSNNDSGGYELSYGYKRLTWRVLVKHPSANEQVLLTAESDFNKMSYADGSGYGHSTNFSTGDGGWNMIVGSFDGTGSDSDDAQLKLYIGGGVDNSGSGMGNEVHLVDTTNTTNGGTTVAYGVNSWSDETDLGIACSDGNNAGNATNPSAVTVDNFFYFDETLTIEQLTAIYNNGKGIDMMTATTNYPQDLITNHLQCHIRFEEGSGSDGGTVVDVSGNGNNGRILGGPTWTSNIPQAL